MNNTQKYESIRKTLEKFYHRVQPFGDAADPFDTPERKMWRDVLGIIDQLAEEIYLLKDNAGL